jgi:dTDP-4-amino-4,6-dideoxygalactose transaminase
MSVPLLDLSPQNDPLREELSAAFARVLKSGHFIMGADVTDFEREVLPLTGAAHGISVSSGTDAILLALMALDIGPGDEVICPSFTFFATAGCISRTGATPIFVDSCPVCFNLDAADVQRKLTSATKAIMPVHLYGQSADMDQILALARERNLPVIEDAAQALGASYKGRKVGSMGTFGCYSFFPSKNLGALGDAGLLVTNDASLAEKARMLRTHGSKPKYYHKLVGGNFRMDTLQAAFLRVKLPHYADYTRKRSANAAYYTEKLSALPGFSVANREHCCGMRSKGALHPASQAVLPSSSSDREHIWNQYTIRFPQRRDEIRKALMERGIGHDIYYPLPLHRQECFRSLRSHNESFPVADQFSAEVLSIPIFPELTRAQADEVISALREALA